MHRVVDATRLNREHPWRSGDEGKRGEEGEGGRGDGGCGRERNDLLGPQECALVTRRAAREEGRHRGSSRVHSRRSLSCKRGWMASHLCSLPRRVRPTPSQGRGDNNNDDTMWEEQDMHGVSGACVRRIQGMDDGGDLGAMATTMMTSRRADCIPPH